MRYLLSFLLAAFLIENSLAQEHSKEPFKGANVIVIKTLISDDSLYTLIGRKLAACGFSIDVNNRDFLQFKTGEKITEYPDFRYTITVSIINKEAMVRATVFTTGIQSVYDWTYSRIKGTKDYEVYQEILECLGNVGEVF